MISQRVVAPAVQPASLTRQRAAGGPAAEPAALRSASCGVQHVRMWVSEVDPLRLRVHRVVSLGRRCVMPRDSRARRIRSRVLGRTTLPFRQRASVFSSTRAASAISRLWIGFRFAVALATGLSLLKRPPWALRGIIRSCSLVVRRRCNARPSPLSTGRGPRGADLRGSRRALPGHRWN